MRHLTPDSWNEALPLDELQIRAASNPHPVPATSLFFSSVIVQSRAPTPAHSRSASRKVDAGWHKFPRAPSRQRDCHSAAPPLYI